MNKTPSGYIAKCQCGSVIGAMDADRTDRIDAGKILGEWLQRGCVVEPRFGGTWTETITLCKCSAINDSVESTSTLLRWIPVSERLPTMGQPIAYRLVGSPRAPKIGFRDCPRAYEDRHPNKVFEWALQTWWTEFDDESESWDDNHVLDWHALAEIPEAL